MNMVIIYIDFGGRLISRNKSHDNTHNNDNNEVRHTLDMTVRVGLD